MRFGWCVLAPQQPTSRVWRTAWHFPSIPNRAAIRELYVQTRRQRDTLAKALRLDFS
jgi:hypothetical protein